MCIQCLSSYKLFDGSVHNITCRCLSNSLFQEKHAEIFHVVFCHVGGHHYITVLAVVTVRHYSFFRQYITFKLQHMKRHWRAVNTCRLTADVTSDDAWKERTSKNMFPWFFFPHIFSCISPLYLRWEGLRHKDTTQVSKARRHLRQIRSNHCGLYRSINATPFSLPLSARWNQNRESH